MKRQLSLVLYGLQLLMYLVSVCLWVIIPEELTLNFSVTIFTVTLTALSMYLQRQRIGRFARSSWFKNFSNTFISGWLILGLLGLFNYMAVKHPWEIDLTSERLFSLAPQSLAVVKNIKDPILMEVYARKELGLGLAQFLRRYSMANPLIQINVIDPELNPQRAQEHRITEEGQVVLSQLRPTKQRATVLVPKVDELSITNGLIKITRERVPRLLFSTGHGESSLQNTARDGLSQLKEILGQAYYQVEVANLLKDGQIDPQIDTLVVWSPQDAFFPQELKILQEYLANGGRLILALMPEFNRAKHGPMRAMLAQYGLAFYNNLVFDPESFVSGSRASIPLVTRYEKHHLITRHFGGQTFFPFSSSMERVEEMPQNWHFSPLLFTSERSYAKSDFSKVGKGEFNFDQKTDDMGPHVLAASLEELPPFPRGRNRPAKIVVFGNASFLANMYWGQGKNFDLFLNTLAYTTEEAALLALDRPSAAPQRLVLSAPHYRAVVYFSVLLGPLLFIVLAVIHYRRRMSGPKL